MSEISDSGDPESREWVFDWNPYRANLATDTKDFDVAIIECWRYEEDEPTKHYELQSFHTESIDSWLKEPTPTRNGKKPSAGFKVVVMPCGDSELLPHLTKEQTLVLNATLGLPNFQLHYGSLACGSCGMFSQSDNSYVFIFRKTTDISSIGSAFRYNPQTNVTHGVFFISLTNVKFAYFEKMPEQFISCSHPLLLPLLAIEVTFEIKVGHLANSTRQLDSIESRTGHGLIISGSESDNPSDYRALVKELSKSQSELYLALATISASRISTRFIERKVQLLSRDVPVELQKKLVPLKPILDERIEWLLNNMEHALIMDGMKERMEAQQTVIFNLIAQADSLINVSLAKDSREMAVSSKQDSSAMKIIALLTTFFLPGTFIASFFAMPLFDWSEPSIGQVANHHFWIYWAVTGPLTFLIMVGVIAWAVWNSRRIQLLQSRARESIVAEAKKDNNEDTDEKNSLKKETVRISMSERELNQRHSLFNILNRPRRRAFGSTTAEP
ncbi:hypothetical protein V8C35DRAFT_290078 [Trichoderma chlorosporum]